MVLNEHHQNIYGLMPSPNIIASALTQKTSKGQIVVLANLLPLHGNPLRVAEEYAMLDNMSNGRVIAGFAPGGGQETFNYNTPAAIQREQFWEAVELIHQAWTREGPFVVRGQALSAALCEPVAAAGPTAAIRRSGSQARARARPCGRSRSVAIATSCRRACMAAPLPSARQEFTKVLEDAGSKYDPFRMGILMSVYVAETDEQARAESHEGVWYFLKNCLKGICAISRPLADLRPGRSEHGGRRDYRRLLENSKPGGAMLGDVDDWEALQKAQSIIVGSPETVYRQIIDLIRETQVGNLLIQFHLGNMRDDLARKSMRLFATEVAPRLREESRVAFASQFAELADTA